MIMNHKEAKESGTGLWMEDNESCPTIALYFLVSLQHCTMRVDSVTHCLFESIAPKRPCYGQDQSYGSNARY